MNAQKNSAGGDNRRMLLWLVAGAYLLYLAFQLGRSLFSGEVPAGTETYVAWGGALVFGGTGAALLVLALRMTLRNFKDSMAVEDEDARAASGEPEPADGEESEDEAGGE